MIMASLNDIDFVSAMNSLTLNTKQSLNTKIATNIEKILKCLLILEKKKIKKFTILVTSIYCNIVSINSPSKKINKKNVRKL